ncbi:O-antigen ligase family protein [Flavitalea sp.]|nr:O-antigen ligase family protein [Flavitalea sp.]
MTTKIFNPNAGIASRGKETALIVLTGIFFFTFYLPGSPLINNIAIVSLVIFCGFFNTGIEKLRLLRQRPALLFIVLFYILQILSLYLSRDKDRAWLYLQVRIPLLLFPISLGLIYIRHALKVRIYFVYALITTLAALVCLVSAMIIFNRTGDSGFIYNDSLSDAIGKQSVYFALMVNVAIFSYAYLAINNYLAPGFKKLAIFCIAFLMLIHFMLASRMEIVFLYTSAIVFALYYFFIKKKNRKAGFIMIGALVCCGIAFVQLFPKTLNRFNELVYPTYDFKSDAVESHYNMQLTPEQWNGLNIRLAIWNCGFEVVKRHPVMGVSIGDKDQALLDVFKEKEFKFGIRTNKNMHNTYLDILASMGVVGLIVFLTGFIILPLKSCVRSRDLIGLLVIIDFILSFITETYPDRSMGCIIFSFFIAFIISTKDREYLKTKNPMSVQSE